MIYRHMYCGYKKGGKLHFKENDNIITSSAANFKDMTFVYFETTDKDIDIYDVCEGDMKPFPNGSDWMEMTKIFHYYEPENDADWERKIPNKKPYFRVNKLKRDKIASYIFYHVEHQNGNQYDCDRYFSIFLYDDLIVLYAERPDENVTWADIEGKYHTPPVPNWSDIMYNHFAEWQEGGKASILLENEE